MPAPRRALAASSLLRAYPALPKRHASVWCIGRVFLQLGSSRKARRPILLGLSFLRPGAHCQLADGYPQTYPVGIGRQDWGTPLGVTKVVGKKKDPTWTPTASIRREHEEAGDPLPRVVPAGPDNPLGLYAMRLGIGGGTYLIHGTNKAFGVGMRASHGCIRMMPEDIEYLFPQIPMGTRVHIVSETAKVGWFGGKLYLEIHEPLEEDGLGRAALFNNAMQLIDDAQAERLVELDEEAIARALREQTGMPVAISKDV